MNAVPAPAPSATSATPPADPLRSARAPSRRACWSAPASTRTSTRRAARSRRAARRSSPSPSAAPTSARTPSAAEPARRAAALAIHLPAQHRRLLHRRRRGAHAAPGARAARRPRLVKLEVLGDPKTLYPNMLETLKAAEMLVKDGFKVMVYSSDDPIIAKRAGRDRLRGGDAAGVADRLGHGHPQPVEPAAHHRERARCR